MNLDEVYKAIGSLGFPIAVTVYLLWERRTTYKELTAAIYKLKDVLSSLTCMESTKED